MFYNVAAMLIQIRAQGHLSACGTIVTPVTTFAATLSSISLLDDTVAKTLIRCYHGQSTAY